MASARYTINIKPEDLLPEEPPKKMTKEQKRANFWFYHKWHVIIGFFVLLLVSYVIYTTVTTVQPDYTIGIMTQEGLPEEVLTAVQDALAPYATDRNGDGKIYVNVLAYQTAASGQTSNSSTDPYLQMAGSTQLMSDLSIGTSMIFLVDDVALRWADAEIFLQNDGTYSETPDFDNIGYAWADCPVLAALPLGNIEYYDGTTGPAIQSLLGKYTVVLRDVEHTQLASKQKNLDYFEDCKAMYNKMTEAAT